MVTFCLNLLFTLLFGVRILCASPSLKWIKELLLAVFGILKTGEPIEKQSPLLISVGLYAVVVFTYAVLFTEIANSLWKKNRMKNGDASYETIKKLCCSQSRHKLYFNDLIVMPVFTDSKDGCCLNPDSAPKNDSEKKYSETGVSNASSDRNSVVKTSNNLENVEKLPALNDASSRDVSEKQASDSSKNIKNYPADESNDNFSEEDSDKNMSDSLLNIRIEFPEEFNSDPSAEKDADNNILGSSRIIIEQLTREILKNNSRTSSTKSSPEKLKSMENKSSEELLNSENKTSESPTNIKGNALNDVSSKADSVKKTSRRSTTMKKHSASPKKKSSHQTSDRYKNFDEQIDDELKIILDAASNKDSEKHDSDEWKFFEKLIAKDLKEDVEFFTEYDIAKETSDNATDETSSKQEGLRSQHRIKAYGQLPDELMKIFKRELPEAKNKEAAPIGDQVTNLSQAEAVPSIKSSTDLSQNCLDCRNDHRHVEIAANSSFGILNGGGFDEENEVDRDSLQKLLEGSALLETANLNLPSAENLSEKRMRILERSRHGRNLNTHFAAKNKWSCPKKKSLPTIKEVSEGETVPSSPKLIRRIDINMQDTENVTTPTDFCKRELPGIDFGALVRGEKSFDSFISQIPRELDQYDAVKGTTTATVSPQTPSMAELGRRMNLRKYSTRYVYPSTRLPPVDDSEPETTWKREEMNGDEIVWQDSSITNSNHLSFEVIPTREFFERKNIIVLNPDQSLEPNFSDLLADSATELEKKYFGY